MTYSLGIDLGTTFTAAAIIENGQASMMDLSANTASIPSVVFLAEDGSYLVGEAAKRRSLMDPTRAARQFKRRFGDTTPIFLGGTPLSADQLSAQLLKSVVDVVTKQRGSEPDHITITHPANWGGYKLELLEQTIRAAGLDRAHTISEPEAAVLHYSQQARVPTGALIAVFDLGGGTFDAAIIRKTETGTEFLGRPEGIERLGGIDFDQAIYAFVAGHLDGALDELDVDDPTTRAALERLRAECTAAKEALSSDEVAEVPVLLPTLQTTVRITRSEFENLIRPALAQAIDALRRALKSADLEPSALDAVLLAGGSSRIPLVAEMVGGTLARPVAVDAHPKHVVALGAAFAAAQDGALAATAPIAVVGEVAEAAPVAAAADETSSAPADTPTSVTETQPVEPTEPVKVAARPVSPGSGRDEPPTSSKRGMMIAAAVAAALIIGATAFFALSGGSDDNTDTATPPTAPVVTDIAVTTEAPATVAPTTAAPEPTDAPTTAAPTTTLPFPPETRTVTLTEIVNTGSRFEVTYESANFEPSFDPGSFHFHFFWNTFSPESVGMSSPPPVGAWTVWATRDDGALVFDAFTPADAPAGATEICAVVATSDHNIDEPQYVPDTVSCLPIPSGP